MKTKETSTREQAIAWWNNLSPYDEQHSLREKYFGKERLTNSLTGREIEEIWLKEIFQPKVKKDIQKALKSFDSKPNQKQFKQFDESLFQAYINKFSNEDKFKAFSILAKHFENHIYGFYKDGDFDRGQNNACYGSFKSRFNTLFE